MCRAPSRRGGVAAVELALLLPFLAFMFVIAIDWARIFYYSVTLTTCARNGALYASDPTTQSESRYANVTAAALAGASNLSPTPTVTSTTGSDSNGSYVEVTVACQFRTLSNFPGVPSNTNLARKVRMSIQPQFPNN